MTDKYNYKKGFLTGREHAIQYALEQKHSGGTMGLIPIETEKLYNKVFDLGYIAGFNEVHARLNGYLERKIGINNDR